MNWASDPVLSGGDECGRLLRELDWSKNPLGPPASWPKELRTLVSVMLGSSQPVLIVWGNEQTTLYNDGYAAMCGSRHPAALGNPFSELWFEIWDQVEPILANAYRGIGTRMDDIQFTMFRNGFPEETHFSFSYTPVRNEEGAVLGMFCVCAETTDQVLGRRREEIERDRLKQMFEQAPAVIAMLEGPNHVFAFANRAYEALLGHRNVTGKRVADVVPEAGPQGFLALLTNVYETGEPYVGTAIPIELRQASGEAPRKIYLDFVYQPLRGEHGKVSGIFVLALDVTGRAESRAHQELRNRELVHRLKNQLAVVNSIVSQTLRTASDVKSANDRISERLIALSKAHDLLLQDQQSETTVTKIVDIVLNLHESDEGSRFDVEGAPMAIAPRPAMSLSLILHELATNAVKYGALSNGGGRVAIGWGAENVAGTVYFVLTWRESGGPAIDPVSKPGTGTKLIKAGLHGAILNEVVLEYRPDGLVCSIRADLASVSGA